MMETLSTTKQYLSVKEAAAIVDIGESTLRKMIARGEGPRASKLGGKLVRIALADFDAWVNGETPKVDDTSDDNRSDNERAERVSSSAYKPGTAGKTRR